MAAIDQAIVDLVGNHQQVVPLGHLGQRLQVFPRHDGARGIVRVPDQQDLGARGDERFDRLGPHLKRMLHPGREGNGRAAGEYHFRLIGDEAGRGDDDFVAGVEHGGQRQIERLRDPDGDQDFAAGIVFDAVAQPQMVGDRRAQFDRPRVGGVVSIAPLDGA
jgi:hypothetical protein